VPSKKHGIIVGPKGATIKDLEAQFEVSIQVGTKDEPRDFIIVRSKVSTKSDALAKLSKKLTEILAIKITEYIESTTTSSTTSTAPAQSVVSLNQDTQESIFFSGNSSQDQKSFNTFLSYLRSPTKSLDICIFTLTDDDIKNTILMLKDKSVKIKVITDDECSTQLGSDIAELSRFGIDVRMDNSPAHMHHKFAIADGAVLINGSFNWTKQAHNSNRENVMVTGNPMFVRDYQKEFDNLFDVWDGHLTGLITGEGFSLTYENHFGCYRNIVATVYVRVQPPLLSVLNFDSCGGASFCHN